ncbi:MAG TPA: CsbD family protein [Mycobacteriales bacterium]|nr:CsbD family protein [Mycobacteriales bacterium]
MGLEDKIKNTAQDATGTMKETIGKATGDEQLESEGLLDQAKAKVKKAGEQVKDAVDDVAEKFRNR